MDYYRCAWIYILHLDKKWVQKFSLRIEKKMIYKVVQIWPGQTVTCLHINRPRHIWTTLYLYTDLFIYFFINDLSNDYVSQTTQQRVIDQ
jgi:hypothetical protein